MRGKENEFKILKIYLKLIRDLQLNNVSYRLLYQNLMVTINKKKSVIDIYTKKKK